LHGLFVLLAIIYTFLLLFENPMTLFHLFKWIWASPYLIGFIFLRDYNIETPHKKDRCVYEIKFLRHLADVLVSGT